MKRLFLSLLIISNYIHADSLFYDTPNSDLFIDRWEFDKLAKFVFDPSTNPGHIPSRPNGATFNPSDVKPGDVIFVRRFDEFFSKMAPKIKVPFIIISSGHFTDAFKSQHLKYLANPKIIAWFGIHSEVNMNHHKKYTHIPLGVFQSQQQKIYEQKQKFNKLFSKLRENPKTKLVYSNLDIRPKDKDYQDRVRVQRILNGMGIKTKTSKISFENYMKEMSQHKFAVSPRGKGLDCYRTWEAMLAGAIPIVKSSTIDPVYKDLPVLIINDWSEINRHFLEKKYKEITSKQYSIEKLFIDYWKNRIKETKQAYFAKHKSIGNEFLAQD